MKHLITIIALTLIASAPAFGFTNLRSSSGSALFWDTANTTQPEITVDNKLTYNIDSASTCQDVSFTEMTDAIAAAFAAWEDNPNSTIAFNRGSDVAIGAALSDDTFVIWWEETDSTYNFFGTPTNFLGALAVAPVSFASSGEMSDTNIVFNGFNNSWSVDQSPGTFDIQNVATHEIGHTLGAGHSNSAVSTMFPRTSQQVIYPRVPARDDQAMMEELYADAGYAGTVGSIAGTVSLGAGTAFGAAVVAVDDSDGTLAATAMTLDDGTYTIPNLAPGDYTVFVQPINKTTTSPNLFSEANILSGYWNGLDTNFRTTADSTVSVIAGLTTTENFTLTSGAITQEVAALRTQGGYSTTGNAVNQGDTGVFLGVAGPSLPTSGSPLSITGSGITVTGGPFFSSNVFGSFNGIYVEADIDNFATPGARNIIIEVGGGNRVIATGAFRIEGTNVATPTPTPAPQSNVESTEWDSYR